MEKKEQEVAEEYLSSLADLNLNSKPLINMLTILAEENIEYAPVIVKSVEQHIAKVNADVKLPVLYLIDSIVKNVGREYIQLFSHCIVNIFCGVFEKVNEKVREKMYTLRQTWNDVFTIQKLYTLDVKVNCMDPNWPITAKVVPKSPAIHVNPNFLKNKSEPLNEMQAKLRDKQRQLLELQKRKLELELAATKQRLEEQEKQLTMQTEKAISMPPAAAIQNNVRPVFNPYKAGTPRHSNAIAAPTSALPVNPPVGKTRVAPVNPTMINTLRFRDPRLARQQLQQQQHHQQQQQQQQSQQQQQQQQQLQQATTVQGRPDNISSVATKIDVSENKEFKGDGNNTKKPDVDLEREKVHNLKPSGYYGNKDKLKSGQSSDKRSSNSKSNYEKNSSSSDKSPNRSSNGSRKVSRTSSKGSISKPYEKDNRIREKNSLDRKKSMNKIDSPSKSMDKQVGLKQIVQKSPKRSAEVSKIADSGSGLATKFKDVKQIIKSRNYVRRNRDKSKSPSPTKDIDFRTLSGQPKRVKLIEKMSPKGGEREQSPIPPPPPLTVREPSPPLISPTISNEIKKPDLEKNLEPVSSMDIDLRQFQNNSAKIENNSGIVANVKNIEEHSPAKRPSADRDEQQQPQPKKSRPEEIVDGLFGTEDVDLRTMNGSVPALQGVSSPAMPMTPPPPPIISSTEENSENWAKVKGTTTTTSTTKSNKISPTPKSTLDDVRAKLAKATKGQIFKPDKEPRQQTRLIVNDIYEDSQDGTDANIRTIMSQAQELLDTENMNAEQYNTLVKTVIHINETNKLKEAQRRESLLNQSSPEKTEHFTTNIAVTPKSNEIKNTFDDESEKLANAKEKMKPFIKRIPKISKDAFPASSDSQPPEQTSILQRLSPPIVTNSMVTGNNRFSDSGNMQNANMKPDKRNRQRESKWSSFPRENGPHHIGGGGGGGMQKQWISNRPNFIPKPPQQHQQQQQQQQQQQMGGPRMPIPNPWQNPPPMIFAPQTIPMPSIQLPPIAPISAELPMLPNMAPIPPSQFSNSVDNPKTDVVRTINIDSVAKEIRIYDGIAVVFMDWDQPREIGFQSGQRRIFIDDQEPILLSFNNEIKTIIIDGKPHNLRFGCPSRELYIDDNWYECCFGGPPLAIPINGKIHIIKIEGPPPQVNIGKLRQDLVAGKINLIVDARIIIPVFLDANLQTFELDGKKHTLQFADLLQTVLINNEPIQVEYGGLPKSYYIGGIKYFARFSTLPNGIVPGEVMIKGMLKTEKFKPIERSVLPVSVSHVPINIDTISDISSSKIIEPKIELTVPTSQIPPIVAVSAAAAAAVANATTATIIPPPVQENLLELKEEQKPIVSNVPIVPLTQPSIPPVSSFNIDDLFQKLLASGILNQPNTGKTDTGVKKNNDIITPIDLAKPETIKTRQSGIIQKLFCGMQCSSCGVRFPPEQTMKYSQHLDWHFRQNRRERDSSRKAHSRKWYYDVSDWIQYEEIEDLEDREKNWFEAQQTELDIDENSNPKASSPIPSCPAGPDDVDRGCDMCHDKFEQFYNEEFEEWHLRSAIRVEDKIYHPLCYQDYKASLAAAEQAAKEAAEKSNKENEEAEDESDVVIKEEKCDKDGNTLTTVPEDEEDDDDDDVMLVPIEESVTIIPDDDDDEDETIVAGNISSSIEEESTDNKTQDETSQQNKTTIDGATVEHIKEKTDESNDDNDKNESVESDVEIQEPQIPFTDLDTYEEQPPKSISTLDESSQSSQFNNIRIKEEPKDEDDDAFEDVIGTIVNIDDISESLDEYIPQPISNNTGISGPSNDALITSMDGNVEIQDTAVPASVNKIKLNITKNVGTTQQTKATNVLASSSNSSSSLNNETTVSNIPVICNVVQSETGNKIESIITSATTATTTITTKTITTTTTENKNESIENEDSIDFTFKPELRNVDLKKMPKIDSGFETSGLCSIM